MKQPTNISRYLLLNFWVIRLLLCGYCQTYVVPGVYTEVIQSMSLCGASVWTEFDRPVQDSCQGQGDQIFKRLELYKIMSSFMEKYLSLNKRHLAVLVTNKALRNIHNSQQNDTQQVYKSKKFSTNKANLKSIY